MTQQHEPSPEVEAPAGVRPSSSPFRLPGNTAPTWEVELLLSGATFFALMQVPAWLSAQLSYWDYRVTGSLQDVLGLVGVFAKVIAYILILTLLAHLMTRALWVAALGLRSVYPTGIRWRSLRYGPRFRAVARLELPTLQRLIDRSDDVASQMFAVAALMVVMTLFSVVTTAAMASLAWLLALPFGGQHVDSIMLGLVAFWLVLHLLANQLDKRISTRSPHSRWAHWIIWVQRLQLRLPLGRMTTGLMLVFTSRFGVVRGTVGLMILLYALIAMAFVDMLWDRAHLSAGAARFITQLEGAHVIENAHYADQRDPLLHASIPYISSLRARGGYLSLIIPYQVQQHPAAIEAVCPGAEQSLKAAADESRSAKRSLSMEAEAVERLDRAKSLEADAAERVLACVARLHALHLDGVALEAPYSFHVGPDSELPSFLVMVPIADLPPGRHVLEVSRLPYAERDTLLVHTEQRPAGAPRQIVFWK